MNTADIYNEFSAKNANLNLPKDPVISSVYIPTIHKNFTNDAIYHVFETLFGCVTRIDTVQIQTPDNSVSNFKSAFVHFIAYVRPTNVMDAVNAGEKVRINPNVNTGYMRKHFPQPNAKIRNKEFWLLLPNNTLFPDTTLTLPQLRSLMDQLDGFILGNEEECESMKANRGFLAELEAKQSGQLKTDTSINVHQLARNIELMEERISTGTVKPRRVITIKAKATNLKGEAKAVEGPVGEAKATVEAPAPKATEVHVTNSIQDLTHYLLWSDDENEAKKQYANICASNRVLLVENILPDCHESELMDNFNHYGLVESVKIIRDPETKDAQRAYVTYLDAKDTEAALNAMNQDVEGGCRVSRLM